MNGLCLISAYYSKERRGKIFFSTIPSRSCLVVAALYPVLCPRVYTTKLSHREKSKAQRVERKGGKNAATLGKERKRARCASLQVCVARNRRKKSMPPRVSVYCTQKGVKLVDTRACMYK